MSKKSFVNGAALLAVAGIIVKIIGAFYRIPLTNIIGAEGLGIYQKVYPVYTTLLVLSTAGFPTAISRLVSQRLAKGDRAGAHRIFKVAMTLLIGVGVVTAVLMYALSEPIAVATGDPAAAPAFRAIAPALLFVSLISAYRGYFQGMEIMAPTASSQIVEQLGKLAMGLYLASAWLPQGVEWGAAGTLLGVSLSELAALVLLFGIYLGTRKRRDAAMRLQMAGATQKVRSIRNERFGLTAKRLIRVAVPITLGAMVLPIVNLIDAAVIMNSLQGAGSTLEEARSLYGLFTGPVNTLIAMPSVLSLALSMALVPSISGSMEQRQFREVRIRSAVGIKLALLLALPCAVGMFVLAEPILGLLYTSLSAAEMQTATQLMRVMSVSVLMLALVQTLTGILQGVGRLMAPVKNLFIGAVIKLILSLTLIGIASINIYGAAIGTITCFTVAAVLDFRKAYKVIHMPIKLRSLVVKPVIASLLMGLAAWGSYALVASFVSYKIAVVVAILVAVVVYAAAVLILGCLTKYDFELLPGGKKLEKLTRKLGLWNIKRS